MDVAPLIAPSLNLLVIGALAFMIKSELSDIKHRITRIENTFFPKAKEWEP